MKHLWITLSIVLCGFSSLDAQTFDRLNYAEFKAKYLTAEREATVFNFWATWCAPCVRELPYFTALADEHVEDFTLILVSLDFPKHIETRLIPYLEKNKIRYQVVVLDEANANNFIDDIDPDWSGSIPATLIWDNKKVGFAEKEFHNKEELLTFIKTAIKIE